VSQDNGLGPAGLWVGNGWYPVVRGTMGGQFPFRGRSGYPIVLREWLRYGKRVFWRPWRDTHVFAWRAVTAVLGAIVGAVLPRDVGLPWPQIWKAAVFALVGYLVGACAEYIFRLIRSPALLDLDHLQSIADLERRIAVVEATQPAVQLRIEDRLIVVHNSGPFGTFVAHLRIIEHHNFEKLEKADQRKTYVGHWEDSLDSSHAEIHNGQDGKLLLSTVGSFGLPGQMNFVFYYMEGKARREIPQVYTIGTPEPPSLIVEVTLSARPELRGGAVVRKYSLTTDGLSEAT
jgi:hypothetical protein